PVGDAGEVGGQERLEGGGRGDDVGHGGDAGGEALVDAVLDGGLPLLVSGGGVASGELLDPLEELLLVAVHVGEAGVAQVGVGVDQPGREHAGEGGDRKSTRLNSSHVK